MRCPRCRQENPPQAKYCVGCAAPLVSSCARCGTSLPAGARFCPECASPVAEVGADLAPLRPAPGHFTAPQSYTPKHLADKILTSRSALEGERKQVTVLFVDVSGFTALSERLDPEDVHRLMTRAFELMLAEVHRYEGTVNQFLGDGIMALFGAPIAHEDHARRAVHAALAIQTALDSYRADLERTQGVGFQVRQGLNTGLVVVGSIGSDLRMDYTAVGDTTNVAARLQQAADRGRVLVSEPTHRLVDGYFYTRPLGHLMLKGKAEPVRAWEILSARAARTRLDVEVERGLTPYVGRARELRLLQECFERARGGQGQVVFVVGEPGIGKSRLLYEFRRWLGDEATWLEGRCSSFGRSIALHPVIDMMKRNFRIEEGDDEVTIAEKIERGVTFLGEDLRPLVPYLRYLLAVDPGDPAVLAMEPQQRRAELFGALRQLLVRASQVRPQVMVIEDVHWMDKPSEESLLYTADSVPGCRILQILTYRTGYAHPFGERTYHTRIALSTLASEDSTQMARAMLAAESLPTELNALIVRRAEGNPFFLEEVVKSLQEVGALRRDGDRYVLARRLEEIVVPDTIQDVIMARIDRLEEAPKKTLQLASVIGREFTRRLLDRIADIQGQTEGLLRELKAIELIYEKALYPELAYMFKHALTHDVAYNSLLVQRRRELHRVIGLAIEDLYAERAAEHYEVLAHHFSRAEDWSRAFDYLLKAAEKSAQAFANREAIGFYDQAIEVAARLGDAVNAASLMRIHQAQADLYMLLSDFARARAAGERRLVLARQLGDQVTEAAALAGMGMASLWNHDFDQAVDETQQAIDLAGAVDATPVVASGSLIFGSLYLVLGRLDESRQSLSRGRGLARTIGDAFTESISLSQLGLIENWQGAYGKAVDLQDEALRIAREHNLLLPLLWCLWEQGLALTGKGDYDDALGRLEEGLALSEKVGDEVFRDRNLNTLGWLWAEVGDLERAADFNRRGLEIARKRGDPETIINAELNLGDISLTTGDLALAQELFEGAHALARNPSTSDWAKWRYSMHLFAGLGELWLARGEPAKSQDFAQQCLALAARTDSKKHLARAWRLQGEIALARRQWDEAGQALGQALDIAQAIGNPTQLWKTHVALGRLHAEARRSGPAREAYQAAQRVMDAVRSRLTHPTLRASFDVAPLIRKVRDLSGGRD